MLNQKMNTMPNEYQYLIDRHAEVSQEMYHQQSRNLPSNTPFQHFYTDELSNNSIENY